MKTIKTNFKETGWLTIDGDVKWIVAHFADGHKETLSVVSFLTLGKRKQDKLVQIDCYNEGEEIV